MPGKRGETRRAIYAFIRQRVRDGAPPTVREIQQAFGFRAVQSAQEHLDALIAEGLLTKEPGKSRSYRLAEERPTSAWQVPLLGRVQAGPLTEAIEELEGYVAVEPRGVESELFGLRVRGDSMRDAGILPGDLVIVRKQTSAQSGEIVVALLEEEATVKRLARRRGRPLLLPENPAYAPIELSDEGRILGVVIEVRRYLDGHRG